MAFNVDDFKSEIDKRGGYAPQNLFNVIFTPPSQALINIDIGQILSSFARGSFNKNGLINDPRSLSFLCNSTSFPSRAINAIKFDGTASYDEKRAIGGEDGTIDMEFYVTNDFYIHRMISDWQSLIFDKKNYAVEYHDNYVCDVTLQALDQRQRPTYGVTLLGAFPSSIAAQQIAQGQTGEQKVTITMDFDTFVIEDGISSSLSAVRNAIPKTIF